jgi:hypothetical protein
MTAGELKNALNEIDFNADILIGIPNSKYAFKIDRIKHHITMFGNSNIVDLYRPEMADQHRIIFIAGELDKLTELNWDKKK